ncbi:dihydropteroate synthase [Winogradskyella sp. PC-19]|uniref:dihydropteroate synthase n=1 Tax=unclassified Winogradskyella TaxID=2615021 RepID=UPI000B3CEFAC|nr:MULTISPECIES: dihydropteroate synthase [unclassified Winogradskyella]ARV09097.1 dihydropteroate synthase [Winogradskyella sp. PC-19]RZN76611.1 MAG: dihydropteroate synthase [Winogradskyella sp.]
MTINCKGRLIDISQPKVMGVLNVTPDSFYDGGSYKDKADILRQVEKILTEGATFIDVGGYSSRPGADFVSEEEESNRVLPVIELILKEFPEALISIDTFRSQVAKKSIETGAALINDISAGKLDNKMIETVGKLGVPYIMMHMRGNPKTMQQQTNYEDLVKDVISYFGERIAEAHKAKINDIIIDPGFGFAKTLEQNFNLLNKMDLLKITDKPILAGVSRKSMIYKTLNATAKEALNGTTALNMMALENGASILRVHDVKEAMECITLFNKLKSN